MSSAREGDGFDDRPGDPEWQPPGWELPAAEPDRPDVGWKDRSVPESGPAPRSNPPAPERQQSDIAPPDIAPPDAAQLGSGRWRRRPRGVADQVFRYQGDPFGVQGWALHHGWLPSDGTGPQDASLADLVRSAPVRASKDHRPANVVRGRGFGLDLIAFDVVYASGRYLVPQWAVTAAPVLGEMPGFRLSPGRFWKHRTGGLLHIPSGDPEFDARWVLLAAADGPQVRRVVEDPVVRQLLLGTDDGDELWSAAGFLAAVRPDGHRPQLIEHHARLLAIVVGALATGY